MTYIAVSISWDKLKGRIFEQFQVSVPVLTREKTPSLLEVYAKLINLITIYKAKGIVSDFYRAQKKTPIEDTWRKIIEEVNVQFNVEIIDWQVLEATKSGYTKKTLTNKLMEVLKSKMWKGCNVW